MKKVLLASLLFCGALFSIAQNSKGYQSLDTKAPIVFAGSYIVYGGDTITLGPKVFFIDGQLSDDITATHPFVFNSVNKAAAHLTDGTEASPMTLYIAPYVYWIDNPDDTAIRVGETGQPPYGLIIKCEWLKFHGLSPNPSNVVLACNRGQTIGARGNFTMFKFIGEGTGSENITFGNYCSVDLSYPLRPALSRKKRASAIVQAQLIHCNGDKIMARNTRFISRLNLCPFVGAKRALFDRCHFESTDDALCGTGVYINCDFDVYGSKPFYRTIGTGAVFLDCDIRSYQKGYQFFTKANGQVAVIDTRIKTATGTYIGWNDDIPADAKNYQYHATQNGVPVFIGKNNPASTIDLSGKKLLNAYRLMYNGKTIYNSYNLLRGDDDWDPMQIKNLVVAAEKSQKENYSNMPVQLRISSTATDIETNKNQARLTSALLRFGNYPFNGAPVKWSVSTANESLVKLEPGTDGITCKVIATNNYDDVKKVIVTATNTDGLEAAILLNVAPAILPAPAFIKQPALSFTADGKLHVNYQLNTKFKDQSIVNWYRCTDIDGDNAIEVAVSRFNEPLLDYTLSAGDAGFFVMATVAPKHIRSMEGDAIKSITAKAVVANDVKANPKMLFTNFKNASLKNQLQVIPGFWTWGYLNIPTNERRFIIDSSKDAWYYGDGIDGATGMTGLLQGRSTVMHYTPVGESFSDMKLTMTVAPFKTSGQGFSVAHLYMDLLIELDTKTMSGYGLRFIRTTKYSDAIDAMFVRYDNGKATPISEPISTTVFRTACIISIEVKGNQLSAHATTTAAANAENKNLLPTVNIATTIVPNAFGGFGIEYNGGSPTMIKELSVEWK